MIWDILGIDKTTDIKKIKSAYSSLAKQYNPEEYPEKFMEIHNAYKEACEYARSNKRFIYEKNESKIIFENSISAYVCDDISKCSINFYSGKNKTIHSENNSCTKESDFDFSKLSVFSRQQNSSTCVSGDEIEKIILDDMNKIVSDKDLINSYYIWNNFLSNRIVVETISSKKNIDRVDEIINHKRFVKEIAELVSNQLGNNAKIIRNTDFGFYYIDVTGRRKLYYYLTSVRSRKIKLYYNVFCFLLFLMLILVFILFQLF